MEFSREFHTYLELLGGSRDTGDYDVVFIIRNEKHTMKVLEARPELGCVERKQRGENMCICGKPNLIHLSWVQRKDEPTSPLILVGSCCVKKFFPKDEKTNTRLVCMRCKKPYKHGKYVECKTCRERHKYKQCELCPKDLSKTNTEDICRQCQWFPPCITCHDRIKKWKWDKWGHECWTCHSGKYVK